MVLGLPRPHRAVLTALSAAAVALSVVAFPQAATAAPSPAQGRAAAQAAAAAPVSHRVTLLTGDVVTVTEIGGGRSTVSVAPQDRVSVGDIRITTVGDDVYVVPSVALPYLASGAFDRALFDVTGLVEQGLTDEQRTTLPLIVQYDDGSLRASGAPVGSVRTRTLPSIEGAAVNARKAAAPSLWRDITGTAVTRTEPVTRPVLREGIAKVWLDGRVHALLADSVAQIGAPEAWTAGVDGTGVKVAVIDSGIDADHPDLAGQLDETRSFVPGETVVDRHGHGTHVASTVAGTGAASAGAEKGVAPGARLLIGKALGDDGYGQDSWIIDAMEWAAQNADVVNLSLGSEVPSDGTDPMSLALDSLSESTDALFVVAAGNFGMEQGITSPAAADAALTVGAVDSADALTWFSSMGPRPGDMAVKPDLVAPGMDILAARSQYDDEGAGDYVSMSGTSMASPHVAGAAALLAQAHPGWAGERLKDALMSTADELPGTTPYQVGSGRVDVPQALGEVTATGSLSFGFDRWPHTDTATRTRTVTYHNDGVDPVELTLSVSAVDADGADAPAGLVSLSDDQISVPAGGSSQVQVALDPQVAADGARYTGEVVATPATGPVVHSTWGFVKEGERYDLDLTVKDRTGAPALAYIEVVGPDGYDVIAVDGRASRRLPPGTYSLATWLDVDKATDHRGTALLIDPEVTLDHDQAVVLSAQDAVPVTAEAPKQPAEATQSRMGWYRALGDVPVESSVMSPVWVDTLYATPTEEVATGDFEFNTRWRFREPLVSLDVDETPLDVIAQVGAPLYEGEQELPVVVVGQGAAADYAGVDAAGSLAVAVRSDAVSPYERAVAAHEAGATMLLVINDADPELSEWVGGDLGESPGIPVVAISGPEGAQFLDGTPPATVQVTGTPDTAWVYDLQSPHAGAIPSDLAYAPTQAELAEVTGEYASDRPAPGGEFRYDFRPYSLYGVGFPETMSLPAVRSEWASTPEGTTWYQEAMVLDDASSLLWDVRGRRETLTAGSHSTSRWFSPVVRPRLGEGYWGPARNGNYLDLNLPSFADSGAGHTGDMYGIARQAIRLYDAKGKLIAGNDDQAMWTELASPAKQRLRLVSTADRDPARWRLSPHTKTTWWFWTRKAGRPVVVDLPLLSLDYGVKTDLAGRVGSGPTRIKLTAVPRAGALLGGAVEGASLQASFDGGKHWQRVSLSAAGSESWRGTVPHPKHARYVSLRAKTWDSAGNSVRQVVERAYRLR